MKGRKIMNLISWALAAGLLLSACGNSAPVETTAISAKSHPQTVLTESQGLPSARTNFITEQILEGAEGIQVMRILGKNMAWFLKCRETGEKAGVPLPEQEQITFTNFIRD